jgi:hypothetical protein
MHQTASQRLRVLQRHLAAAGAPRPRLPVLSSLAEDRSSLVYGAAAVAVLGVLATGKCCTDRLTCISKSEAKQLVTDFAHPPSGLYTRAARPALAYGGPPAADSIPYSYPAASARGAGPRLGGAAFASIRPFTSPANRFQLFRITGDGSCMFRAVVQVGGAWLTLSFFCSS